MVWEKFNKAIRNLFIFALLGLLPPSITLYVIGAPNGGHGKQF